MAGQSSGLTFVKNELLDVERFAEARLAVADDLVERRLDHLVSMDDLSPEVDAKLRAAIGQLLERD